MSTYIVFQEPHTPTPLTLPQGFPPIAVITRDFPDYVKSLPCIHIMDSKTTFHGHAACEEFFQSFHTEKSLPEVEKIAEEIVETPAPEIVEVVETASQEIAETLTEVVIPAPRTARKRRVPVAK